MPTCHPSGLRRLNRGSWFYRPRRQILSRPGPDGLDGLGSAGRRSPPFGRRKPSAPGLPSTTASVVLLPRMRNRRPNGLMAAWCMSSAGRPPGCAASLWRSCGGDLRLARDACRAPSQRASRVRGLLYLSVFSGRVHMAKHCEVCGKTPVVGRISATPITSGAPVRAEPPDASGRW